MTEMQGSETVVKFEPLYQQYNVQLIFSQLAYLKFGAGGAEVKKSQSEIISYNI